MERLISDAPGDTRRALRRISEGNLGRIQSPALEALGDRINRNLKGFTDTLAAAAFMVGGSMLITAPRDLGWHHQFGQLMIGIGVAGMVFIGIASLRYDRSRDQP